MNPGKNGFILDDTDHLILELLQRNARITMRDLATRVNMSPPGAAERVRRLEEEGIITGYHASVNLDKAGMKAHGYIVVDDVPYSQLKAFYEFVQRTPELYSAETIVSGGREAVLKVACPDTGRLMEINREFYKFCQSTTAHLTAPAPTKKEPAPTKPVE